MTVVNNLLNIITTILQSKLIMYPLAIVCILIGLTVIISIIYSITNSYFVAKKTGVPVSWFKVLDDIRWSTYDWYERDQTYVISLPRLVYFISTILIIFVVLTNRVEMLTPLLGFNISAMVSYTSKKYIEKDRREIEDKHLLNEHNKDETYNNEEEHTPVDVSNLIGSIRDYIFKA